MTDAEKPEFYQDCDKLIKHFESLTSELQSKKDELAEVVRSREDALKQTKFNYEIACSLNSELHRYANAMKKIQVGLNNVYPNSNAEGKTGIDKLSKYIKSFIPGADGERNGVPVARSLETESRKKSHKQLLRSIRNDNEDALLGDSAGAAYSNADSSINAEFGSDTYLGNDDFGRIKKEVIERPMEVESVEVSVSSVRNREGNKSLVSDITDNVRQNSGSLNSGAEATSEDKAEQINRRRTERRRRLNHSRTREGDARMIPAQITGNRAVLYDIPRIGNPYMSIPDYGQSPYNQQNNGYYDLYNSGMVSYPPIPYYHPSRHAFNGDSAIYNGLSNGVSYPMHDHYGDYMNGGNDIRSSQTLADSSEEQRRSSLGPNALKLRATYLHDDVVCAVALGGDYIAATASKGLIKLWDTRKPSTEAAIHNIDYQISNYVRSCKLSEDGKKLMVAGEFNYIGLWDLESYSSGAVTSAPIKRMEFGESASACLSLIMADDGRTCYSGCNNGNIVVWDLIGNRIVRTIKGHTNVVTCMDMPANSNTLYSGSLDCTAIKWDIRRDSIEETIKNHSQVFSIAAATDNRWVTVGLENSVVNIFAGEGTKIELKVHTHCVLGMKMAANNTWLLSVGKDGMVNAMRMPHGPPVHRTCEDGPILSCDMSADAKNVLTGSSGRKCSLYDVSL